MEKLKRVVIKEELVALTGDFRKSLILNQFIYWSERVKDFDKWISQEKDRAKNGGIEIEVTESNGWIYKNAEELNDEIMLGLSMPTLRKLLKELIEAGYIQERRNPKYKWDKTLQYRVDLVKVQTELIKLGYSLEGYKLLDGILESKKAPTAPPVEAKPNKNNNNPSISQNNKNYTSKNKEITKGAGSKAINQRTDSYSAEEIENITLEKTNAVIAGIKLKHLDHINN